MMVKVLVPGVVTTAEAAVAAALFLPPLDDGVTSSDDGAIEVIIPVDGVDGDDELALPDAGATDPAPTSSLTSAIAIAIGAADTCNTVG